MTQKVTPPAALAHLSTGQRAILAAERVIASHRMGSVRLTFKQAAEEVGLDKTHVQYANEILLLGAHLVGHKEAVQAIRDGYLTVYMARKILQTVPDEERTEVIGRFIQRAKMSNNRQSAALDLVHKGVSPQRDRIITLPAQKQVGRAISSLEVGAEVLTQHVGIVTDAEARAGYIERLRTVRTQISRAITTLEKVS